MIKKMMTVASASVAAAVLFAPTASALGHLGAAPVSPAGVVSSAVVPQSAWDTLSKIDAGQWPPNDGSGTRGGAVWANREGTLPRDDAAGNPIGYREWDVNPKRPGQGRDAERIVTGDDGSAWYTGDLFATFTRMR
ncbi:ribonuclease [Streptomyces sp. SID2955]|nr:ribonuclease [Streptomyces sp. SID2955]